MEDPNIVRPEDRERVFGQRDHIRLYGRDYKTRLEQAGFQVVMEDYARELGDRRSLFELAVYGKRPSQAEAG